MEISLPISLGEALDKLSILDIKLKKIKDDQKIKDVKKEYELLYEILKDKISSCEYYYKLLVNINSEIWNSMDILRNLNKNTHIWIDECNKTIIDNDRRFRVKSKINNLCNSSLKEQKGYVKKKAFVLTHLGLGDNINTIGLVRHLSTCYDEVLVVCRKIHQKNMEMFYSDDNSIKLYFVENDCDISPSMGCSKEFFDQITFGYDLFLSGYHRSIINKTPNSFEYLPFNFYKDSDIVSRYFWDYFHIPEIKESMEYYNYVKDTPYIVMNNTTSGGVLFNIENIEKKFNISKDDILFIDLNKNVYESTHKFYEIAQKYVGIPLLYYTELIKNASKVILSDSSILCMALHLDIKTDECYYISRDNKDYSYLYNFDNLTNIKKFKRLF